MVGKDEAGFFFQKESIVDANIHGKPLVFYGVVVQVGTDSLIIRNKSGSVLLQYADIVSIREKRAFP